MIEADKIKLVQRTFDKLVSRSDEVADEFYNNLFTIDPDLKSLFATDRKIQEQKFMATLMTIVIGLDNLENIIPSIEALGLRHVSYNVKPGHYTTVAAALLTTLEKLLGDDYTPEVRGAWTEVYWLLSKIMIDAAESVESVENKG